MGKAPVRAATSTVIPAGMRSRGRFPACEGGFPMPRKQAGRAESRVAALRDGSFQAYRPSSSEPGVTAHD